MPTPQHPDNQPVRVTGEERPHPAVRTLARACIALVRWQREQEQGAAPDEEADDAPAPGAAAEPSNTTKSRRSKHRRQEGSV